MTADPEHLEPFHWFGPDTCAALAMQLTSGPVARLEIRGHGEHMTLTVVRPGDAPETPSREGPLNESHLCPPFCP